MQAEEKKSSSESSKDTSQVSSEIRESKGKKRQKADDNVESSSTGSDGGKGGGSGSGSGGGYSADCSSSDASSLEAAKGNVPEKEMTRLSVNEDVNSGQESAVKEAKSSKSSKSSAQKIPKGPRRSNDQTETCGLPTLNPGDLASQVNSPWKLAVDTIEHGSSLPQWNGVRVRHPMDPRIDISTVGHIQTSALSAFPSDEADLPAHSEPENKDNVDGNPSESSEPPPPTSIDQYMKLMEVVRPFFHAHGISHEGLPHARSDDLSNERPSSDFATEPSDSDQKKSETELKVPVASWNAAHHAVASSQCASYPSRDPPLDPHESDSSSMVVLARVKKKHLKKTGEDYANDGSNNSTNDGSNISSESDRRVGEQRQIQGEEEVPSPGEGCSNEEDSNDNNGDVGDNGPQAHAGNRQESTSASSSEDRNNQEEGQAAPIRYGVPAVVSEYSSSRTGSSGASNNNVMSTSGSGSGGNTGSGTGSGTASGSNQGGSCGSGNDQGISSNGIGSSGSGNDVKGSSEETMDNSGENNSGENSGGNSDATNSNKRKDKATGNLPADAPHIGAAHRHASIPSETMSRDSAIQPQHISHHDEDQDAAREKKLQDKKRKRMNMRREYEEKVQQEMESSEGSRDRGETAIRPGRPVTLDKVLSFTKIPRIVIKEGPPFLVVYTNAAYCRLTGVDSHVAVGKPISSLLSIPEGELITALGTSAGSTGTQSPAAVSAKAPGDDMDVDRNDHLTSEDVRAGNAGGNHLTYYYEGATNRMRTVASRYENTEMCLERLVAASGFGRCHVINARTKPRQMIGRNVAIMKPSTGPPARNRDELSFSSSGKDGSVNVLPCSMSVSPVVSSPEAFNVAVVTDKDQDGYHHKTKRRKHHHHGDSQQSSAAGHHQHRRNHMLREVSMHRRRHLITHYVIQIEPFEGGFRQSGAPDSQSSTSTTVEANILGLTKSELRRQRMRTAQHANGHTDDNGRQQADENDDVESESTDPKEPVTAIG